MGGRMRYTTCPFCGARSIKASPGSVVETKCQKCDSELLVTVDENGSVRIDITKPGKGQEKN